MLDQYAFRWGHDDGTEATHTWLDAQNVNVSLPLDDPCLLRIGLYCPGDAPATSKYLLFYKKTTDIAWREVINTGTLPIKLAPSAGSPNNIPAGGEATTNRLSPPTVSPTPTFTAGRRWCDESAEDDVPLGNGQFTELEFSVMAVSANGAVNGDMYDFRLARIPGVITGRTDNFNRGDTATAIGTPSDGGSAWLQLAGTWGIASNQA
ncbi:MAG TPA: hypothetical protein VJT81_00370, partial [Burkholderiales bacterium]|nr:hypothetical protein [Burkholderiales bacterium]